MTTTTTTRSRRAPAPVGTKSDRVRDLLRGGTTIADAARSVGIGYAFAYGIAKRAGLAETNANRRPEPNSKIAGIVRLVQPNWSADRVNRTAAAIAAGTDLPKR